jgi:hypothetical protein
MSLINSVSTDDTESYERLLRILARPTFLIFFQACTWSLRVTPRLPTPAGMVPRALPSAICGQWAGSGRVRGTRNAHVNSHRGSANDPLPSNSPAP